MRHRIHLQQLRLKAFCSRDLNHKITVSAFSSQAKPKMKKIELFPFLVCTHIKHNPHSRNQAALHKVHTPPPLPGGSNQMGRLSPARVNGPECHSASGAPPRWRAGNGAPCPITVPLRRHNEGTSGPGCPSPAPANPFCMPLTPRPGMNNGGRLTRQE